MQSLTGASEHKETGSSTGADLKRVMGGLQLWSGVERMTRVVILLLLGAGVGGLLLPQGRAAVAQAKFGEFIRVGSRRVVLRMKLVVILELRRLLHSKEGVVL